MRTQKQEMVLERMKELRKEIKKRSRLLHSCIRFISSTQYLSTAKLQDRWLVACDSASGKCFVQDRVTLDELKVGKLKFLPEIEKGYSTRPDKRSVEYLRAIVKFQCKARSRILSVKLKELKNRYKSYARAYSCLLENGL